MDNGVAGRSRPPQRNPSGPRTFSLEVRPPSSDSLIAALPRSDHTLFKQRTFVKHERPVMSSLELELIESLVQVFPEPGDGNR